MVVVVMMVVVMEWVVEGAGLGGEDGAGMGVGTYKVLSHLRYVGRLVLMMS